MEVIDGNIKGLKYKFIKTPNFKTKYVALACNFGGKDSLAGDRVFPQGIAHFIEHKLLMQQDGKDGFNILNDMGVMANAYTSSDRTVYYFSGYQYLQALKFLVKSYFNPHFVKHDIEKEKSIIAREIAMTKDYASMPVYEALLELAFGKMPISAPIAGNVEDVLNTTIDDIISCYEYFYTKDNSMLVIVGDIDFEEVIQELEPLIPENRGGIPCKNHNYPLTKQKDITIYGDINVRKFGLMIRLREIPQDLETEMAIGAYLDQVIGPSSKIYEELLANKILIDITEFHIMHAEDYYVILLIGESINPKLSIKVLKQYFLEKIEIDDVLARINLMSQKASVLRSYDNNSNLGDIVLNYALKDKNLEEVIDKIINTKSIDLNLGYKFLQNSIISSVIYEKNEK